MPDRTKKNRRLVSALVVTLLSSILPAGAVTAPPLLAKSRLGLMTDARVNLPESYRRATAARTPQTKTGFSKTRLQAAETAEAVAALKQAMPGLDVTLSSLTGAPEVVENRLGALTAAAPGRSSEEIVREFLAQNGLIYGLSAADLNDLVALGDSPGGTSGLRMLRMEQQIDGLPVFQSESRFLLDREGKLVRTLGVMVPHARSVAPRIGSVQWIAPEEAVTRLLAADGRAASPKAFKVTSEKDGHLELSEQDDTVAGPITASKVLFPLSPGLLVPAWSLTVFTTGEQDWYAVVDAETGDLLWCKGVRDYASAHDARFRVYVQADGVTPADSPAPQSPNTAVPGAGTQFAEIAPTIVSMHTAMDATASPNGWINDCPGGVCTANETQTLGNNVLACLDRTGGGGANVCDTDAASVLDGNGRPTGNPDANSRNRDFLGTAPRDFQTNFLPPPQGGNPEAGQTATGAGNNGTLAVDQFRRGMVTHLFYLSNWYHDQLFKLGFDEASGNFQATNFSGMGAGNDRVLADAQDSSGTDNANFSTFPDGTSGRMQMYRFTGPTIDRDGSLDAEVVLHELSHGTSNRLVGNATGLNWEPARGMGEGWSDFYALSLINNTNADTPTARFPSGSYSTYKLSGLAFFDNYVYGIRRYPYTSDRTINPMTWADVDDVTNNLSGGSIPPTPVTFNLGGAMEVHNSGEIWALTLWGVRARIIADPAGANGDVPTGNHTALQLVTDGLKMTPVNPTFIEARDAILAADCATNGCANEQWIWDGFADRGLGYGAAAPYKVMGRYIRGHEAVHESFSVPFLDVANPLTDVTIDDSAANNNGAIDPGEPIKLTVKLTNPWRAAVKAVTGATATLTTTTTGVTVYDGTSTYGAIAPQGSATGDTFLITVDPSVACGSAIDFTLSTTSNLGTTTVSFRVRMGTRNGTDPVVTYTGDPNPDLTITDNRSRGVFHQINVTDDYEIADLDFRLDSLTHAAVDDLTVMLRSPGGIGLDLIALVAGLNDCGGTTITNMVIDDDLPAIATNDMVQATSANSPFSKSWLPVYNSPWAALVDPIRPADPSLNLARYDGTSTKGTWSALVADNFSAAANGCPAGNGTFNSWSILVTPVHFDCVAFAPAATVSATKTVAGTFQVGGTVTYTVTITNSGTGAQADNAGHEFTDVLPSSLTLVSANASSGTAGTSGNTVNWDGVIAPLGGTVTITITATINAGTQGTSISNQGTVSYDSNNDAANDASALTDDPAVGGATDPTAFAVSSSMVNATKTVSGTFTVGGTVTYTITLSNSGAAASPDNAGHELTDTLPSSLTLVSANATSGTASTAGNTVNWDGSIPGGGSVTITITATINAGTQGTTISNQASFAYDADLDGSNESTGVSDDPAAGGASDPTSLVVGAASLTATKTVSGTFTTGSTVTYTIVISNTGASASPDNAGHELTDTLPAALTLTGANATAGTAATAGNTVNWDGSVPANGTVTITITATINAGFAGTTVSNQGTVSYDADLNGSNETTAQTDDPAVGGATDPTRFVVQAASVSEIPTLSEWGLMALGLGLLLAAVSVLRRKRMA